MSSESEGRSDQPEGETARVASVAVAAVEVEGAEGGSTRGEVRRSRASYLYHDAISKALKEGRGRDERENTENRKEGSSIVSSYYNQVKAPFIAVSSYSVHAYSSQQPSTQESIKISQDQHLE